MLKKTFLVSLILMSLIGCGNKKVVQIETQEKDAEQKMLEETAHRIPEGRNNVDLTNSFRSKK